MDRDVIHKLEALEIGELRIVAARCMLASLPQFEDSLKNRANTEDQNLIEQFLLGYMNLVLLIFVSSKDGCSDFSRVSECESRLRAAWKPLDWWSDKTTDRDWHDRFRSKFWIGERYEHAGLASSLFLSQREVEESAGGASAIEERFKPPASTAPDLEFVWNAFIGDLAQGYNAEILRTDLQHLGINDKQALLERPIQLSIASGEAKRPLPPKLFDASSVAWSFWSEWYQGFLDGKPMDWELQRRVALIDDAIWEAGPEAVAEEIERIRAAYEVEKRAAELEEHALAVVKSTRGIGDNNPPSPIEDALKTSDGVTIIWAAAQELKEEAQSDTPNSSRVKKALSAIVGVMKACGLWAGKKIDASLNAAVIAAGGAGGAAFVAWVTQNGDKISDLIKAVENWLPFLS